MKNPIRTYLNWYGRNLVEISTESAGKALVHYGKFTAKVTLAAVAVTAVVYGGIAAGYYIHDKIEEAK